MTCVPQPYALLLHFWQVLNIYNSFTPPTTLTAAYNNNKTWFQSRWRRLRWPYLCSRLQFMAMNMCMNLEWMIFFTVDTRYYVFNFIPFVLQGLILWAIFIFIKRSCYHTKTRLECGVLMFIFLIYLMSVRYQFFILLEMIFYFILLFKYHWPCLKFLT